AILPSESNLDLLLISILQSGQSEEKKLEKLFGPVIHDTMPIRIGIYGECNNPGLSSAVAYAGVFLGQGARSNTGAILKGHATAPHAVIYSLLLALKLAKGDHALHIFTRSEYIVRAIVFHSEHNSSSGWTVNNGDLLKQVLVCICRRTAPLTLEFVPEEKPNGYITEAKKLA
ncbi:hypothetical protein C8J56DRAFT_714006, partial [Mycena floridula]